MTWNVLVGREPHVSARPVYKHWADVTVASEYEGSDELNKDLHKFDAIVLGGIEIGSDRIETAINTKIITSPGVGLDSVDIQAATEAGIIVCNNTGANTRAVAEYSIAAMLSVRREFRRADRNVRSGIWDKHDYMNSEVADQAIGVFGYGAIGQLVTDLAQGLDMDAYAYDPYVDEDDFRDGVTRVENKKELFSKSDAVAIHAPLTKETQGAIGMPELQELGENGILINASRGPLVETEALVEALTTDLIHGAAIDVYDEEPADSDHHLFQLDDILVTPHIAGSTKKSVPAKHRGAALNVKRVHNRDLPESTVNLDELCLQQVLSDDDQISEPTAF